MKEPKAVLLGLAAVSAAVLITAGNAQALVAGADIFGLDFRFNNPGARANAMGGAFIGLADDATAAYTNPAGLTILTKPEISMEGKAGDYTTRIFDMTGTTDYTKSAAGLSFLSYAYPAKNATITVFRHQLLNIGSEYNWREQERSISPTFLSDIDADISAVTYGIGMGAKMTDNLSLGLAAGFVELDYKSTTLRYVTDSGTDPNWNPPPGPESKEITDSGDSAEIYTLSLLWNMTDNLNLGLVYRSGPKFNINKRAWEYNPTANGGDGAWENLRYDENAEFKIPDLYGIGLSYRFAPNLTMAIDANFVEYSDLIDEFKSDQESKFNLTHDPRFKADDEWEFRFGLEYVIDLAATPLALRAGYYFRPDHRVYYDGDTSDFQTGANIKKGDDDHIGSLGVGFLVNENLQVDLAGSYGDLATEGFVSMVYRFE